MRAILMQVTKHVKVLNTVLVVAIISVLGCGPPGTVPRESAATPSAPVEGTPLAYEAVLCINEARINVLVADTPQERAAGLSGYAGLPEDAGMLFVFPEPRQPSFWMKGMEFALDLIWIRDGTVVQIRCLGPAPAPKYAGRPTPALPPDRTDHARAGTNGRFSSPLRHHRRRPRNPLHRHNANTARCKQDRTDAIAALNRAILQRATASIWIELRASTPLA